MPLQLLRQFPMKNSLLRFFLIALVFLVITPLRSGRAAPSYQSDNFNERAQALLDTLTPEERVGQLFLVTFMGTEIDSDTQIYDLIVNRQIGGVILQSDNDNFLAQPQTINQALQLVRGLQTNEWRASQSAQIDPISGLEYTPAFIPLFVGLSQEGNGPPNDQIISGLTPLPSQMAVGATWQPEMARQVGMVLGSELSALGINLLLGPSLDVLENPQQQGTGDLGVRCFGGDPFWVGEMGRAFVRGVHEGSQGRISVVGKHFPGYGSSDRLPEEEVATVRKSLEQLKQIELPPFYAVTGNASIETESVDAILASHIRYQGFQGNIRETTRPVSLDPQAFSQLMELPAFFAWREKGGVMISDNLGSQAVRNFFDPTGQSFNARLIARDAFLTGNDLLFLGHDFIATEDQDSYTTILRTLAFFAQKYREDAAFQQQVDKSVLRILALKYRLYEGIFTLNQVLSPQDGLEKIGDSSQVTFSVAQEAATLISPSLAGLAETLPEPPNLNERIVFISDTQTVKQCSQCASYTVFSKDILQNAVFRLYGPLAGGQVLQRNMRSYSFEELQALLDADEELDTTRIEADIRQANWIVFSMLSVSTDDPSSLALSRFLAERPDLFRQKKLVVFALDAPYYLDATEVSKLNAYFGLYSKTPQFLEVAARLLFGEIPAPPGDLPVSVQGVDYDLISASAPDPTQTIQLFLDLPTSSLPQDTTTPEPTIVPEFQIGELIPVRTGIILDHNGHPVPDGTPVQFILTSSAATISQTENTSDGIARTTFLVEQPGLMEIRAVSEPALNSTTITFDIPPEGGITTEITPTDNPTGTPSPQSSPTSLPNIITTPQAATPNKLDLGDWFIASLLAMGIGAVTYWLTALSNAARWGIRSGFLTMMGGLIAYSYLAFGLPGSNQVLQSAGTWGILLITIIGSSLGWGAALSWQRMQNNTKL